MIRALCAAVVWLALALPGAAQPRILAFGDSLTAGFALPRDQGLTAQLERWLAYHGTPATIINAGLSGDTTYGGRVRIGWSLRARPDAVIVALGANDMLMGWSAARAQANLDAILTQAGAGGRPVLLVGVRRPSRGAQWDAIWPDLARRHDAVLLADLVAPLTALAPEDRAPYLLADGLHPSARGVALLVERLGPQVQALMARLDPAD